MPSSGGQRRALTAYVVGIVGLITLVLVLDATRPPSDFPARSATLLIVVVAITAGAEQISFRVHRGWISAAATLPHITAVLLFPPAQAELIGLFGAVSYGLSRRVGLSKLAFNAAVVGLAVAAASHVALALGGPQLTAGSVGWMGPLVAVLVSATYYLVSVIAVSVAVALDNRTPPWPLARGKFGFLALADLGLGLTGAVLAVVLTTAPTWAPAILLPAVLVYLVKRSHERLSVSESRLEAIIASAMDAIITVDDERRIVVFNGAAEVMFGYARSQVLGMPVSLVLVEEEAYPEQTSPASLPSPTGAGSGPSPPPAVACARRASGEQFPIEMTRADLQVQGEGLSTLVVRDVTARRIAEDERMLLLESERAARVAAERATRQTDEFLLMAAHELRTPITSVRGYAQLMRRRLDAGEVEPLALRRSLEVVDRQSAKLARLVSLLLDVCAIQADALELTFQQTDLAALVRQCVVAAQADAPEHAIAVDTPETLVLLVDSLRLQQVIDNLLENAIRFSPWGGAIEVGLSCPDGQSACLAVRDYGLGVSPDHRPHLFDRFYRAHSDTHTSGVGLGLFVTRHLVERHAGTIQVTEPASGGTRFVVRLPLTVPTRALASVA